MLGKAYTDITRLAHILVCSKVCTIRRYRGRPTRRKEKGERREGWVVVTQKFLGVANGGYYLQASSASFGRAQSLVLRMICLFMRKVDFVDVVDTGK